MSLKTQTPSYGLTGGDKEFDAVQVNSDTAAIQMFHEDIDSDDVTAELQQSLDSVNFDAVASSSVKIDKTKSSHTWNITGITPGLFIRVAVFAGTATDGTITKINTLS